MSAQDGAAPLPPLPAPINGTEQLLHLILAELRAIRAQREAPPPADGTVELSEPRKRRGG